MKVALIVLAGLFTAAAGADSWSCSFSAECRAGQACADTHWPVTIDGGQGSSVAILSSATGDTALMRLNEAERAYAAPELLVTITATGNATLSLHDHPARSYLGFCEVQP